MSTINIQFIKQVNELLEQFPASVTRIISTPTHNAEVGGAPKSKHLTGEAIDLVFDNALSLKPAAQYALQLGFGGIELDYRNLHMHLDNRDGAVWHVVHTPKKLNIPLKNFLTQTETPVIT